MAVSPLWMSESTNLFEQFVKGDQTLLPINLEQCTAYFHNAGERIIARGENIIKAVKSRLDEYEKAGIGSERLAEDMCTRVCMYYIQRGARKILPLFVV